MVVGEPNTTPGGTPTAKPIGVPQDKIDNIMGGISNTGAVKMNNHRKRLRQRFDIIKKLGQGTYGKVQLGINKETGQEVAIKTIKKCKIEAEADLIRIRREVQIMSSVQHPNIIHIYEVFENREKMVLVMEFAAGGELYDYLSERKVLVEDEARRIFRQVSTAVYYCHKHKICHRDLKLENILLDEHGNAKIADFGLSNVFDEQRLLATFCGSPLYASPEIVKGTPYQGPEVDCWSLGVLLYTLVYGSMPFDGSNFKRLVKQISQGDYYEPKKPSRASPLIREMLTVCPKRRATIEQICNHWWVNEGYKESCLDLAEDLANQTPVRLDVLLSLTPSSVTADQLVVPSADQSKANERVPRSHSVGSIRDMGNTEAERRILDMVAAGGEAALMPSPTRTITPTQSPIQSKRKLENTVSTENATGAVKKKEKPTQDLSNEPSKHSIPEMEVDEENLPNKREVKSEKIEGEVAEPLSTQDLEKIENICEELIGTTTSTPSSSSTVANNVDIDKRPIIKQKTLTKLDSVKETEEATEDNSPTKIINKFVNRRKTADLVAAINKLSPEKTTDGQQPKARVEGERKTSLPDDSGIGKIPTERRRSRILETAEKFQNMSNASNEKPKKIIIPGVSVGNFKKEFERKASLTSSSSVITPAEKRALEKKMESDNSSPDKISLADVEASTTPPEEKSITPPSTSANIEETPQKMDTETVETSSSKSSINNFSLEEARRSMENSIALLNQAKDESSKEVDQLCAKTENVAVSDNVKERERKLKNAREIIGNAIQPGGRLCMGVRKPPVPFGINGRSVSGSVVPSSTTSTEKRPIRATSVIGPETVPTSPPPEPQVTPTPTPADNNQTGTVKTSRAEITLKSATLPRRKTAKTEIQLDIKPKIAEQPNMRFSTEMQHQMPDLRSAPIRETPYSPISNSTQQRATSLEPQQREHIIPIQRPPNYARTSSNSFRSGSLSRQSTNESDTDTTTTTTQSQSNLPTSGSSQPIKKSPREFIIPIAIEGGGVITPRSGSLEPSESNQSSSSAFSRINRPRRMGSLLNEADSEEESPFQKIRTPSLNREGDNDEPRFILHRLSRSTRPTKKLSQDANDSQSSGEDDDEDGFEILTAENLFSTLLQRVRALTNRLNVNNDITTGFPNSRLLSNMRQSHGPFWNQEPFVRSQFSYSFKSETVEKKEIRLNSGATNAPWRRSVSRDLGSDMDSMFSRTGATLPRGKSKIHSSSQDQPANIVSGNKPEKPTSGSNKENEVSKCNKKDEDIIRNDSDYQGIEVDDSDDIPLDLADLDLSRLRLSKKDLETLSNIAPGLPKCFQDQLLAKLPPTQARKLSRTLSMQNAQTSSKDENSNANSSARIYKRSFSGGRELDERSATLTSKTLKIIKDNKLLDSLGDSKTDKETPKTSPANTTANESTSLPLFKKENNESSETLKEEDITFDRSGVVFRKSSNRTRTIGTHSGDYTVTDSTDSKSRSTSVCKSSDEINGRSLCSSSYSSDISEKYKYYSPYLSKRPGDFNDNSITSPQLKATSSSSSNYDSTLERVSCLSPTKDVCGRPPSGCLSPPPSFSGDNTISGSSLRRRSSQRKISRFLRPDFFDQSNNENPYVREKKQRERETQNVLKEIRERSRERSRDRRSFESITNSTSDEYAEYKERDSSSSVNNTSNSNILERCLDERKVETKDKNPSTMLNSKTTRNKSVERFLELDEKNKHSEIIKLRRRSLSKPREIQSENSENLDKSEIANKILEELQVLSAAKSKCEEIENILLKTQSSGKLVKDRSVPKIKKTKSRGRANEETVEKVPDKENSSSKKVSKAKSEKSDETGSLEKKENQKNQETEKIRKESKLVRPKSYPTKTVNNNLTFPCVSSEETSPALDKVDANHKNSTSKECKISRPKSFPNSKIIPIKELKRPNRSSGGIPLLVEKEIDKPEISSQQPAPSSSTTQVKTSQSKSILLEETDKTNLTKTENKEGSPTSETKISCLPKKSTKIKKTVMKLETPPTNLDGSQTTSAKDPSPSSIPHLKEKSPEKKGKGLLYAIGQKFERLRESSRNKEKKSTNSSENDTTINGKEEKKKESSGETSKLSFKKKKSKSLATPEDSPTKGGDKNAPPLEDKTTKLEKKSRIDNMIRSLRERSVPRTSVMTESGLIKRAVSVEDMSGAFTKSGVNKVLGLFKRFEKDGNGRKVMNTRSTSNIERQMKSNSEAIVQKDRPKSSGFVNKFRKNTSNLPLVVTKTKENSQPVDDKVKTEAKTTPKTNNQNYVSKEAAQNKCPDCGEDEHTPPAILNGRKFNPPNNEEKTVRISNNMLSNESTKEKRKGLTLDFTKIDNKPKIYMNGNHLANDYLSYSGNYNNNNSCTTAHMNEINHNLLTPSIENITNYSSDSRSPHDDCASTSTFLSPTEDPELFFDNWSICSEDNFMISTPSPTVSRLSSRTSQLSSPNANTIQEHQPESVIDRIKRRSFYCRFNEKKPKRQSSIVGPAARDYYRESVAKLRSRPPDRVPSPELEPLITSAIRSPKSNTNSSTNSSTGGIPDYLKPLKLSSIGNDLKPPHYKDYLKPRKSLNDIYPTTSSNSYTPNTTSSSNASSYLTRRYPTDEDSYSRNRNHPSTTLDSSITSGYYNTYNPSSRRSSFNLNGILPTDHRNSVSNNIESYATLGRKVRPYDHRSISLLDSTQSNSTSSPSTSGLLKRGLITGYSSGGTSDHHQQRIPSYNNTEYGNLARIKPNLHARSVSVSRSPSNI